MQQSWSICAAFALTAGPAWAFGPDWVEDVDAGSSIETAQPITQGEGVQLLKIFGRLAGTAPIAGGTEGDFVDLYQILVTDPIELSFSTVGTSTNFQSSIWLFDENGFGLLGNIFAPDIGLQVGEFVGSEFGNFSTDETGIFIKKPGIYYFAICGLGREPIGNTTVAGTIAPIFDFQFPGEVSGPDGAGGGLTLGGWFGDGQTGDYEINVTGVGFVPTPGAVSALLVSLVFRGKKRRSR